jgi:hypothetical protein
MKNIAFTKEIMSFSRKEIEEMIKQVERNPENKFLKSILNKMQCYTSEEIIEEIMEMASKTFPDNSNEFIILIDNDKKTKNPFLNTFHQFEDSDVEESDDKPSRHCDDIRSFLEDFARGAMPLNSFEFNNEFNLTDSDGEAIGHHCRVYDEDVWDLKERFIACVCGEIPESPHVIAYKLIKSLDGAPEAIESICRKNQSQIELTVTMGPDMECGILTQDMLRYCASSLRMECSILTQDMLRYCASSLKFIYSRNKNNIYIHKKRKINYSGYSH